MKKLARMVSTISLMLLALYGQSEGGSQTKFFGVEKATVVRKAEGAQSGTITEHFKDWGNKRVEIHRTEMNIMGMTIPNHKKTITEGEWVTTVDLEKKTATRTKNPMYQSIVKNMKGKGGVEVGKSMVRSMGGRETGETARYAGEKCRVWEIPNLGQKLCVTDDGLTLWSETNMAGMRMTMTAIEVRRGDPGPNSAYKVGAGIRIMKGPDLGKIREMMKGRGQ